MLLGAPIGGVLVLNVPRLSGVTGSHSGRSPTKRLHSLALPLLEARIGATHHRRAIAG